MMVRNVELKWLFVTVILALPAAAPAVVIDTVPVGDAGNTADTRYDATGYGAVDYTYNIGKYEVTAGQYTEFLNAVAATDTYGLYNTDMWSSGYGCKIQRSGSSGSYTYSVGADWANRPVNYVSWGDAARFANWLHNGQPSGAQDSSTTEDGAYALNGVLNDADLLAVTRNDNAAWLIPTEDEWYKAAYHKNDGTTGNYWDYPSQSNTAPTAEGPSGTGSNGSANYNDAVGHTTQAGAYHSSDSAYGTFDQGGNVWEWNEAVVGGWWRGLRGGSFFNDDDALIASCHYGDEPTSESAGTGFRVASSVAIPEPASVLVWLGLGVMSLLWCRRRSYVSVR